MLKRFRIAIALTVTNLLAFAGELNFYSSGSTGADGPFAPEVVDDVTGAKLQGAVPPGSRVFVQLDNSVKTIYVIVPLPQSGVFNFTTFHLPKDYWLAFDTRGTTNPGVVILATGDMKIGGVISVGARETWLASTSNHEKILNGAEIISNIPGPGGFRGGLTGGFGANQFPLGPLGSFEFIYPFSLPLVGGAGGSSDRKIGGGGGGTLIVASSKKILFEDSRFLSQGVSVHFSAKGDSQIPWRNDAGNYGPSFYGGNPHNSQDGSILIISNETRGRLSSQTISGWGLKMLVCAFEQEFFYPSSMSPPWPVGVRGGDMPVDPSARFVEFAGKPLTAEGEPDRVILDKSGEYKLALETRNLPPGIVFVCTLRQLNTANGSEAGRSTLSFPPTVATAAGVCRAEMMIPITPGGTYITAIATKPIETVYSPIIDGEPLTEMVAQLDLQGGQTIHFKTASGRQVDAAMAHREALKQGKTRFPAFKS
jgi:hypothetical protein